MSKYIKSFNSAAELISYYNTAEGKKYYTLMNTAGEEGIGTSITSGKKIISAYKSQYDYLTFTAVEAGATVKYKGFENTTAEYSTDGGATWNNGVGVSVKLSNIGDSVKYRGVISANISPSYARFEFSKKISASGSIMSMYNNNPDDTKIVYTGAFMNMFEHCTSLTSAPELPATTLASNCYKSMFLHCSGLTTAPDELPATTLASNCYESMFLYCYGLTTAPELQATTMASNCYRFTFHSCSSLTSVTHHIKNWNTSNAGNWLYNVAPSGIVKCPANSTIPSNNNSGIPSGWTRENL